MNSKIQKKMLIAYCSFLSQQGSRLSVAAGDIARGEGNVNSAIMEQSDIKSSHREREGGGSDGFAVGGGAEPRQLSPGNRKYLKVSFCCGILHCNK